MTFDPKAHLIQLPRRVKDPATGQWVTRQEDYLEVRWRVVMFREKYPHGVITTESWMLDWAQGIAVCQAIVEDGEGGKASAMGTETRKDFEDFVEKAGTRAVGRALALLGFGTQFVGEELEEGEHIVDAPVTTTVAAPPAATKGHAPAPETPKGAPKNLVQKSDLLREIQAELTRLGCQGTAAIPLYRQAFGEEVTTWELVCGESLHTLKHGLVYLKTLPKEVSDGATPGPAQVPAATATPATTEAVPPVDPPPAASAVSAAGSSSAPAPSPDDAAERDRVRLRAEVANWDLRVPPEEVEHVIQHNPYSKARALLWKCRQEAAA